MSQMFGVPPTMFPQQQQGPGSYYGQQQPQQHSPLGALAAYKGKNNQLFFFCLLFLRQ